MGTSLQDMLNERPVDREAVNAHKRRMVEDVLVHRLRELREEAALTQVDTLRRYIEVLGGSLHVEVELGDQRFQIA